jgi:hypothetical protein
MKAAKTYVIVRRNPGDQPTWVRTDEWNRKTDGERATYYEVLKKDVTESELIQQGLAGFRGAVVTSADRERFRGQASK